MDRNLWNELSLYQSNDLVRREYKRKHDLNLNAEKAWEIISCFIQAREYFANAQAADLSVRPLLLYYGVLSFSRGIVLFLEPTSREATLKSGHGLKASNWDEVLTKTPRNILDLAVSIEAGTFTALNSAAKDFVVSRYDLPDGGLIFTSDRSETQLSNSTKMTLYDMASRTQYVDLIFRKISQTKPNTIYGTVQQLGEIYGGGYSVSVAKNDVFGFSNIDHVRAVFQIPETITINTSPMMITDGQTTLSSFMWRIPIDEFPNLLPLVETGEHGGSYVIAPLENGIHIPAILRSFVIAYILGMLARYYPSRWMALIRNQRNDETLPLLLALIDYLDAKFPEQALHLVDGI